MLPRKRRSVICSPNKWPANFCCCICLNEHHTVDENKRWKGCKESWDTDEQGLANGQRCRAEIVVQATAAVSSCSKVDTGTWKALLPTTCLYLSYGRPRGPRKQTSRHSTNKFETQTRGANRTKTKWNTNKYEKKRFHNFVHNSKRTGLFSFWHWEGVQVDFSFCRALTDGCTTWSSKTMNKADGYYGPWTAGCESDYDIIMLCVCFCL